MFECLHLSKNLLGSHYILGLVEKDKSLFTSPVVDIQNQPFLPLNPHLFIKNIGSFNIFL